MQSQVPCDAVLPGRAYQWQKLPDDTTGYLNICIGTIIDPNLMWVQLEGAETTGALNELMNDLDEFYTSANGDKYVMRDHHVVQEAVCAGVWSVDDSWHRVLINGVMTTDDVDVLFVDYGTRGKVKRSQLRYLKKCFMNLPAQAIKSRMAFVKPKNKEPWDIKVRDRLLAYTRNKVLCAEIVPVPFVDRVPLWICDTTKGKQVNLSELLIEENLANFHYEEPADTNASTSGIENTHTHCVSVPPRNFTLPAIGLNLVNHAELINALSVLSRVMPSNSKIISKEFIENIVRSLNICNKTGSPVNAAVLYRLISCEVNPATVVEMLGLNANAPVNPPVSQNSAFRIANVATASSGTNYSYFQGGTYYFTATPKSGPVKDNTKAYSASPPPMPTLIKPERFPKVKLVKQRMPLCNSSGNGDSEKVLVDHDDDKLKQFCSEYSSSTSERFVCRVELRDGYRFHIIVVKKVPYVSSGDISNLLWSHEKTDYLRQRLRGRGSVSSLVISSKDYPLLFEQLHCCGVKGIKDSEEKTVTLYLLNDVVEILNVFGHPSQTIRDEIMHEIHKFDPSDQLWKQFSYIDIMDNNENKHVIVATDTSKFNRMCIFDLNSAIEALRFKRLKIKISLEQKPNDEGLSDLLTKFDRQLEIYQERIKEIHTIISSSQSSHSVA